MANGEMVKELRATIAQYGDQGIPPLIRDRLVLASLADIYDALKDEVATKKEVETERACLQTGINTCNTDIKKLETRVNGWGGANTLGVFFTALFAYLWGGK